MSVAVRVRGDATHLGDCLDSVLGSSYRVREVLLAADGDHGVAAVQRAESARRRVRAVGEGPGDLDPWVHAGTCARGDLVLFVDGDDLLPAGGLEALASSLQASGSDAAVGLSAQVRGRRRTRPTWAAELLPARGVPLRSRPAAVVDPEPTGKLFRSELWRSAAGPGPAAATAVRALLSAAAIDAVADVVHERHDRQAARPVGDQDRFRVEALRSRVATWSAVTGALSAAPAEVRDAWLVGLLAHHVPPAAHDAVAAGDAFAAVLAGAVREVLAPAGPLLAQVPLEARLTGVAAASARRTELAALLDHLADHPHGLPTEGLADGGVTVVVPPAGPPLPDDVRRVRDVDRVLRSRAGLRAPDDLLGAAFVTYDPERPPDVALVSPGGERVAVAAVGLHDPALNEWAARGHEDRSGSGFRVRLDEATATEVGRGGWSALVEVAGRKQVHRLEPPAAPAGEGGAPLVLTGLRLSGGALVLSAVGPGVADLVEVRLAGRFARVEGASAHAPGDRSETVLPLLHDLFGEPALLPAGDYRVEARARDGSMLPVVLREDGDGSTAEVVSDRLRVALRRGRDGGVVVTVAAPLDASDRSPFGQQRMLTQTYAAARNRPRGPGSAPATVLLEAFRGRSTGDNPGAVGRALAARSQAEGLDLDLAYVVDDPSAVVPDGARAVARRTREWYDALGGAAAYVCNAGAPYWFTKADGQLHVQTWHGTPLKRIGEDRGPGDFATWRHRRRIAVQAAGWDAMVSSGPYVTDIYAGAFGFAGPVLEVGYPRNDVLLSEDAPARRELVRARLGLSAGQRVVLYAPTWREYVGVRDPKPLYLDAEGLVAALPDAAVLVRGHYNSTREDDVFVGHPRIHDVTRYPEIADLFLAADVLVTDYSSVMFDFALTDRPQVLLLPDLEQYRDVERGFYFDIERRHPGPLVSTTGEVVDVLREPDAHADARAAFRREFCSREDGHASDRVADFLLQRLSRGSR